MGNTYYLLVVLLCSIAQILSYTFAAQKRDDSASSEDVKKPTDCEDAIKEGILDPGIYEICPEGKTTEPLCFRVFCKMDADGEGWTIIDRRGLYGYYNTFYAYQNWEDYKNGFGDLKDEFWLGLDKIRYLTKQGNYTLRIDIKDNFEEGYYYAEYDGFTVGSEESKYPLQFDSFVEGTAGDALTRVKNKRFCTYDDSGEIEWTEYCRWNTFRGGWWYENSCNEKNIHGVNFAFSSNCPKSKIWLSDIGQLFVTSYEMKVRRKSVVRLTSEIKKRFFKY